MRGAVVAVGLGTALTARPALAQYRIADALTWADIASGSWSALRAACDGGGTGPGGGAPTTIGDLPAIPGAGPSPSARSSYLAASAGFAAFGTDAALRDGRGAGVAEARLHVVPPKLCWFDAAVAANGSVSDANAFAATVELRALLAPGTASAPAVELTYARNTGGAHEADAGIDARLAARVSATTPNLYALTLGRLADAALGAGSPKLDLRARLFFGGAKCTGNQYSHVGLFPDRPSSLGESTGGGGYAEVGGTVLFGLLHLPVSLLLTSEHVLGSAPVIRPRARDGLGVAMRLPGFDRNLWVVARAQRNRAELGTTMDYRIELAHLLIGSW